jgi:hypothetical protein
MFTFQAYARRAYKNIDFLDFLRFGSKDIDDFANGRWKKPTDARVSPGAVLCHPPINRWCASRGTVGDIFV